MTIVLSVQMQTREDAQRHSLAVACSMGDGETRLLVDYSCSGYTLGPVQDLYLVSRSTLEL